MEYIATVKTTINIKASTKSIYKFVRTLSRNPEILTDYSTFVEQRDIPVSVPTIDNRLTSDKEMKRAALQHCKLLHENTKGKYLGVKSMCKVLDLFRVDEVLYNNCVGPIKSEAESKRLTKKLKVVRKAKVVRERCQYVARTGNKCKRADSVSGYCWDHAAIMEGRARKAAEIADIVVPEVTDDSPADIKLVASGDIEKIREMKDMVIFSDEAVELSKKKGIYSAVRQVVGYPYPTYTEMIARLLADGPKSEGQLLIGIQTLFGVESNMMRHAMIKALFTYNFSLGEEGYYVEPSSNVSKYVECSIIEYQRQRYIMRLVLDTLTTTEAIPRDVMVEEVHSTNNEREDVYTITDEEIESTLFRMRYLCKPDKTIALEGDTYTKA